MLRGSDANILTTERREQLHRLLSQMLDELPVKLERLGEAEQQLQAGMQRLATASMQGWAEVASTASPPPTRPGCAAPMRHRGLVRRTLVTIHGTICFARPRRRCDGCDEERYPLDERLCFASHGVSWRVAAKVSRLGSLLPSYDLARQLLAEDYGIELSKHSIEQIVCRAGEMLSRANAPNMPRQGAADGSRFATTLMAGMSSSSQVLIWDASNGRATHVVPAEFLGYHFAYAPVGTLVAADSYDPVTKGPHCVGVWDVVRGKKVLSGRVYDKAVLDLTFSRARHA